MEGEPGSRVTGVADREPARLDRAAEPDDEQHGGGGSVAAHHFLPMPCLATTFITASCSLWTSFAVAAGSR